MQTTRQDYTRRNLFTGFRKLTLESLIDENVFGRQKAKFLCVHMHV